MRAKLQIESITQYAQSEVLKFRAVCANTYGPTGEDEDNSYARWTPTASLEMSITNPDLRGKFAPGQKFYVDFTPAQ